MGRLGAAALAALGALAGCLGPGSTRCPGGGLCPEGFVCVPAPLYCATPEDLAACEGHVDYDACLLPDGTAGTCLGGTCGTCLDGDGQPVDLAGCTYIGWTPMTSMTTAYLNDVWVTSPTDAYAVGMSGTIRRYDGARWNTIESPLGSVSLLAVWAGGGQVVIATEDGRVIRHDGTAWAPEVSLPDRPYAVWGTAADNVIVVGRAGLAHRFDGTSWSDIAVPTAAPLNAVWGASATDIYAAGGGGEIWHNDGGAAWTASRGPTAGEVLSGLWGSDGIVYAVGRDASNAGLLLRRDGASWTRVTLPSSISADDFSAIWGTGIDDVFAVDRTGTIIHYDGVGWVPLTTPAGVPLDGISGAGSRQVIAVGSAGTIWRYTGASWAPLSSAGGLGIYDVWGASSDEVIVVGDQGMSFRLNADRLWEAIGLPLPATLNGIWGRSAGEVYAVGGDVVYRYDGSAWLDQNVAQTAGSILQDITGDATQLFVAGDHCFQYAGAWNDVDTNLGNGAWIADDGTTFIAGNGIRRYDGGITDLAAPGPSYNAIWGTGDDVFAVGAEGAIVRHDGSSWTAIDPTTSDELHDIWGTGADDIFAVGDAATLLHCVGRCNESARPWPRVVVPGLPPDTVLRGVRGVGQSMFVAADRGIVLQLIRSPVR